MCDTWHIVGVVFKAGNLLLNITPELPLNCKCETKFQTRHISDISAQNDNVTITDQVSNKAAHVVCQPSLL